LVDLATRQTPGRKQCAESRYEGAQEEAEKSGENLGGERWEFEGDPAGGEEISESSDEDGQAGGAQENAKKGTQKSAEGGFHRQPQGES
jgi:hypothetical protein